LVPSRTRAAATLEAQRDVIALRAELVNLAAPPLDLPAPVPAARYRR
jgi:hypothetical protein